VELGHDQVLVVTSVADEGDRPVLGPLGLAVAGQVAQVVAQGRDVVAGNAVALGDRGQPQLDAVVHVGRGGLRVALEGGAVAVHRVQVQGRPAQVAQVLDDRRRLQGPEVVDGDVGDGVLPVGVGRDVVVDELAPVGVHGRDGGVPDRLELLAAGWRRLGQGLTQPPQVRRDGGGVAGQVLGRELGRHGGDCAGHVRPGLADWSSTTPTIDEQLGRSISPEPAVGVSDREHPTGVIPVTFGECERGDSNPHGLPHRDLNPARLPFRHARRPAVELTGYSAGRSWIVHWLPSGSPKKTKEFQRPPLPSTRSGPS
jgi:hypothetical protein